MSFDWDFEWMHWLAVILTISVAVLAAVAIHWLGMALLRRIARRTTSFIDDVLVARLKQPLRWLLIVIAVGAVQPSLNLDPPIAEAVRRVLGLGAPALLGWLVISMLGALNDIAQRRYDISVADNLTARRRRTRAGILYRISIFVVLLITFCLMLMSIPSVRTVGVTIAASAGLAALAVGAAAQPALKNLIAGIQMAFTEPIRIDDVVIMDNEWGRIEDIRLTYVVVRIWDDRRLVVPVSKFLEQSFQNWTRETSALLGTAFLRLDHTADVARIRSKLDEVVRANPLWDGRVIVLHVTELYADHMELRCLVSASDAGRAFDLRCDVREALITWIAGEEPGWLVRTRAELRGDVPGSQPAYVRADA
ncbi:small-conductance mechanosensitive channel [Sphingomonas zeicaulis]|uniref:mechanosensitive ion channel family protein n=1 Tax=Sphingomonas zeicaulis TaxID=1632740 RepID=UPI003D261915